MNKHIETLREWVAVRWYDGPVPAIYDPVEENRDAALDWALSLLAPKNAEGHAAVLLNVVESTIMLPVIDQRTSDQRNACRAGAAALIEREQLRERIVELERLNRCAQEEVTYALQEVEARDKCISKLESRSISCCFCGCDNESLAALKQHSETCPKHPAVQRVTELEAALDAIYYS